MSAKKNDKQKCPYWSEKEHRCTVTNNGLFIPLENYIASFCTTDKHSDCAQYSSELQRQDKFKKLKPENRRKHPRFEKNHRITLKRINESGNIIQHQAGIADTVDLSAGGMQITTREPLISNSILHFNFGKTFPSALQKGLAKVKWCHYHKESLKYTVGLAFQTERMVAATQPEINTLQ